MSKSWKQNSPSGSFTFIDLFAGIGGFRIALESFGGVCIFSSEWDKNSQLTYFRNHGDLPHGDITKVSTLNIPSHDVLCAGFPCQAFSISGKQKGFDDTRGTLFFDIARITNFHKPKILFLENVKNLISHNHGNTFRTMLNVINDLGYDVFYKVLKSSDFGVPQARERIYIVCFRKDLNISDFKYPNSRCAPIPIKKILEENVDSKYFINRDDIKLNLSNVHSRVKDITKPIKVGIINKGGQGERIYSIDGAGITLSAYGGGAASKTGAYLVSNGIRKLTPRECARLQGFPEDFEIPGKDNIAYKQFGDSLTIPVVKLIFNNILKTYPKLYSQNKTFIQTPKEEVKLF
jgi:DNA (cytosine-5)-methyltransferase 1